MSPAFDLNNYTNHHILNRYDWDLPFLPPIQLPEYFSLHALMIVLCSVFLIILFCVLYQKKSRVPTGLTNFLESLIVFVRDKICIAYLGEEEGRRMTPLFCTFFFFILTLNLMGLIPIFSTATANINVTAALACITLCFMVFGCVYKNGLKGFFNALKPSGVPMPILFILIPIEVTGLFIKTFALTIRLFANMLAGHIVIISLLAMVVILGKTALPTVLLAVFIYALEILVAFLQAFIFTLLSAMFVGQMYRPQH